MACTAGQKEGVVMPGGMEARQGIAQDPARELCYRCCYSPQLTSRFLPATACLKFQSALPNPGQRTSAHGGLSRLCCT